MIRPNDLNDYRRVERIYQHEKYNTKKLIADISLLKVRIFCFKIEKYLNNLIPTTLVIFNVIK